MLYAILCYDYEAIVSAWTAEQEVAALARQATIHRELSARGRLGPVARFMPTTAATTIRAGATPCVIDGPFAETTRQLLGFHIVECATLDEAIETACGMVADTGVLEIRPLRSFEPGDGLL